MVAVADQAEGWGGFRVWAYPQMAAGPSTGQAQATRKKACKELAVAQKTDTKMGYPGKCKHRPKPAVCPSCLILSHTQLIHPSLRIGSPAAAVPLGPADLVCGGAAREFGAPGGRSGVK